MANELFTTRSGKQVPVPVIVIPPDVVTSAMRLQEDYAARGKAYKLTYVILEMLSVGKDTIERRWNQAAKNKDLRETGKSVKEYIRVQLTLRRPIDPQVIAELSGMTIPEDSPQDSVEDSEVDLTDVELDAATAPDARVS